MSEGPTPPGAGAAPEDTYTHGHHESVLRSHTWRTVANSAPHLVAHLRPGLDVLDVGCGPGTITADLADRVAPGRVVGLDRAEEVVARAAATCADRPDVEIRVGDVYALPFADGSFDVVHAHQVLQHLSDPVAALVEARRVCRPGGVVAVRDADYSAFAWAPADPDLDAWLALYRAVARSNGAEPDAGPLLCGWARAAGFAEVEVTASAWCFATPEERTWWGELWAERTTSSALAEQAEAAGLATASEREAMADAFRRWAAADDGVFVVPHTEVLARP
ncbi:methyltransferase domain-containing protein [Iamia majanohamensis]|uniref:Methyltransferase domain-containing protein n=1 Tax=Iamia majanohamensis TaxID=467976 RepID=A0AAE9Y856_9ACTN|nr:methyltransferase domain-containing protein [Iamia majanohamensis]WCO68337.1 methyltransferase domain-containing protein [Iamia majanohamensis]